MPKPKAPNSSQPLSVAVGDGPFSVWEHIAQEKKDAQTMVNPRQLARRSNNHYPFCLLRFTSLNASFFLATENVFRRSAFVAPCSAPDTWTTSPGSRPTWRKRVTGGDETSCHRLGIRRNGHFRATRKNKNWITNAETGAGTVGKSVGIDP